MTSEPLPTIIDEARRLGVDADREGVPVRLVGGLAVRLRALDAFSPVLQRDYRDIDLVTQRGGTKRVTAFLEAAGYEPQRAFNGLHGGERLLFHDVANRRQLDVFVGAFRMCHTIPIGDRLLIDAVTLPLAELLLTKLQVVKLNEKDLRDIVALLLHHDVADRDGETINAGQVARLCADDWGLWRTCRESVERVRDALGQYVLTADEAGLVRDRLARLWEEVERTPKSRGWRLRDRVGDRKQWYDDPEEVGG